MNMSHANPYRLLPFLGLVSTAFLGGCYHESWTFRAVPNVNVTRPYEPGSEGPLVLVNVADAGDVPVVKHEPGDRIKKLTPEEIARMDPVMGRLLSQRDEARQRLHRLTDVEQLGESHPKVREAQLDAEQLDKEIDAHAKQVRSSVQVVGGATPAAEKIEVRPQTVLVLNQQKDFGSYDKTLGRSVVLFIDGAPGTGEYWLNADNSVLISYSAYTPPARTRVGLVGSVKIIETKGDRIVADVAIRETTEADTSTWVEKPYDPQVWQTPWIVTGRHEFQITTPEDPTLRKAAVLWEKPSEKVTAAQ